MYSRLLIIALWALAGLPVHAVASRGAVIANVVDSSPIAHIEVADETQTKNLSASEQSRQELEEELKIRRALAQQDADAHLPYVAQTLQKLSVLDYREHRTEQARQQLEEVLKINRELAQKNPASYLPGLAQALHNLGELDLAQKQKDKARKEFEEALTIYRELAQKDPNTYLDKMALTLNYLGRPIQAMGLFLLVYWAAWPLLLATVGMPLVLLFAVGLLGWLFRHSVARSMRKSGGRPPNAAEEWIFSDNVCVADSSPALRRLEVRDVELANGQEIAVISEVENTTRRTRLTYSFAALAYATVVTVGISISWAAAHPDWSPDILVALIYMLQWVPLLIWSWFLGMSSPLGIAALLSYLVLGLLLATLDSRAALLTGITLPMAALFPLGLLLLLARPLRPWLLALAAYLIFSIVCGMVFYLVLQPKETDSHDGFTSWQFAASWILDILALVYLAWILREPRKWYLPVAGLGFLAAAGLLILWSVPNSDVGSVLLAFPLHTLQIFMVWLLFKLFVLLEERQFLPPQVLQSHFCWGFLTIYLFTFTVNDVFGHAWLRWIIVLAYSLYLFILHWTWHRIRVSRVARPGKRLLFLRVFGDADKRENLLEELENTWRRVGRIDLIAGTDLATRTLASRMLEAFLLLRTSHQFLKTDADVDRRLEHLSFQFQGDARYPVNPVYCYASAWQHAVTRLAPDADVILMDLRGFTRKNRGCIFELAWIVQRVPLHRIILLINAATDFEAVGHVVHTALADLPRTSPHARKSDSKIVVVNYTRRSRNGRRALFTLLLRAACRSQGIASVS